MKRLLLGSTALAAMVTANCATAADMPVKAPVYRAPVAVAYNWSGLYVGGHVGYAFGRRDYDVFFLPDEVFFGSAPFTTRIDSKGWLGGIQAGYNVQQGILVAGIEADFSFGGPRVDGTVAPIFEAAAFGGGPIAGSFQQFSEKMKWLGTVRGRLGVTPAERLLVYATGGFAYGHTEYSVLTHFNTVQYPGSSSKTATGWTAGGGAELAIAQNWTARLEYLYYDLGSHSFVADRVPPLPGIFVAVQNTFETKGHIVRAALNYKFDWAGPVVARY